MMMMTTQMKKEQIKKEEELFLKNEDKIYRERMEMVAVKTKKLETKVETSESKVVDLQDIIDEIEDELLLQTKNNNVLSEEKLLIFKEKLQTNYDLTVALKNKVCGFIAREKDNKKTKKEQNAINIEIKKALEKLACIGTEDTAEETLRLLEEKLEKLVDDLYTIEEEIAVRRSLSMRLRDVAEEADGLGLYAKEILNRF